jgi:hypothetical protein
VVLLHLLRKGSTRLAAVNAVAKSRARPRERHKEPKAKAKRIKANPHRLLRSRKLGKVGTGFSVVI